MQNAQQYGQSSTDHIKEQSPSFLDVYLPYWPVILFTTLLTVGITYAYLTLVTPKYESTASIMVKDENKGLEETRITESINLLSSKKILENEIEILQSRSNLRKVVDSLSLYYEMYMPGRIKAVEVYQTAPVKVLFRNPQLLNTTGKLPIQVDLPNDQVIFDGRVIPLDSWEKTSIGEVRFERNVGTEAVSGPYLLRVLNPKTATDLITDRLKITSAGKKSSLINLVYLDNIPERGERILGEIIKAYEAAALSDKNELTQNTLSFLDTRLKNVSGTLDSIEQKIEAYRTSNNAFDLSMQGKEFLENVSANDRQLTEVNMKLSNLRQLESTLQSDQHQKTVIPSTLGIDDPVLIGLLNKLTEAELQYENVRRISGEKSSQVLTLDDQIGKLKANIIKSIAAQKSLLEANRDELTSAISSYASQIQSLPQQERYLLDINRELNIVSTIYSFLLQKREETALSLSSTIPDVKVVDKPEASTKHSGLAAPVMYLLAVLAGILLSVRLLHAREKFNSKILFKREVDAITRVPVIAEIIRGKRRQTTVVEPGVNTLISEQFRFLKSSLKFIGLEKRQNRIIVTSSIPSEGKSFVATNLALSFVQGGKRTVLVDFDLRNPTVHKKLGIVNSYGVSDYLNEQKTLNDIIHVHHQFDNFFIITAGESTPGSIDKLIEEKSQALIQRLGDLFDIVIIDSPPVGAIADAYSLSGFCDLTLYIVRHKYTPKKILETLDENNSIYRLKNPGIVLNSITKRGFSKSPYQYSQGYRYSEYIRRNKYYTISN